MALNANIPLAGRTPDFLGAYTRGTSAADIYNKQAAEKRKRNFLSQHGDELFAGDQRLLSEYAAVDLEGAQRIRAAQRAEAARSAAAGRAQAEAKQLKDAAGTLAMFDIAVESEDPEKLNRLLQNPEVRAAAHKYGLLDERGNFNKEDYRSITANVRGRLEMPPQAIKEPVKGLVVAGGSELRDPYSGELLGDPADEKDDGTAAMQNFEFYQGLSDEQKKEFIELKRSGGITINTGDQTTFPGGEDQQVEGEGFDPTTDEITGDHYKGLFGVFPVLRSFGDAATDSVFKAVWDKQLVRARKDLESLNVDVIYTLDAGFDGRTLTQKIKDLKKTKTPNPGFGGPNSAMSTINSLLVTLDEQIDGANKFMSSGEGSRSQRGSAFQYRTKIRQYRDRYADILRKMREPDESEPKTVGPPPPESFLNDPEVLKMLESGNFTAEQFWSGYSEEDQNRFWGDN